MADKRRMQAAPAVETGRETGRARGARAREGGREDRGGRHARRGEETAREHREIQQRAEELAARTSQRRSQGKPAQGDKQRKMKSVQPADRALPELPYPEQHQEKPGEESELRPRPHYEAPTYEGSNKLNGMTALITGGDSGIGRAVAVLFAREGADVAIVYLSEHGDAKETKAAVEAEGRRALLIAGDVTEWRFCVDAVERTVKEFGKLDILVNNAAFQQHARSIEEITAEQFDRTMRTNIYGYFHMARAALRHIGSGGCILNTGSVTGIEGAAQLLDYSITKGAIHTFTKSLAQSLVEKGIRVNCVAPGPVWTPLNPADQPAKDVATFGSSVPMKRPAQPEEIAPAYVFLAAPSCSSYITGEVLPVLGGRTV